MSLLSMTDCSDGNNRIQAQYELDRALMTVGTQAPAEWAIKWGRALLEYSDAAPTEGDLEEAQGFQQELSEAETEIETLKTAIRAAISDLQDAI